MQNHNFTITKAGIADFEAIFECIQELAEFERAREKVTNNPEQMKLEKDFFECYIARDPDGNTLGIALYFFAYYTWVGKSLYLDDIYVKEKYRRTGIGKALLKKVFEAAKEENCSRVRFQVLDWNTNAIEFYKKTGATLDQEWINCDYGKEYIRNYEIKNIFPSE
jgi:GNAT superfamily N-acetyltransferase